MQPDCTKGPAEGVEGGYYCHLTKLWLGSEKGPAEGAGIPALGVPGGENEIEEAASGLLFVGPRYAARISSNAAKLLENKSVIRPQTEVQRWPEGGCPG